MALNLASIRESLQKAKSKGKPQKHPALLQLSEGKTIVRMVPCVHQPDNPFLVVFLHYNYAGQTLLSPITLGDPDPVKDYVDEVLASGKVDVEEYKSLKKMEPSASVFVPVVVVGKEVEGVKYLKLSNKNAEDLANLCENEDWGDLSSATEGRNLEIEYRPKGHPKNDTSFPQTVITPSPKTNKLSAEVLKIVQDKSTPKIEDCFPCPTYDELSRYHSAWVNSKAGNSTPAARTASPKSAPQAGLDEDLEDLFPAK